MREKLWNNNISDVKQISSSSTIIFSKFLEFDIFLETLKGYFC